MHTFCELFAIHSWAITLITEDHNICSWQYTIKRSFKKFEEKGRSSAVHYRRKRVQLTLVIKVKVSKKRSFKIGLNNNDGVLLVTFISVNQNRQRRTHPGEWSLHPPRMYALININELLLYSAFGRTSKNILFWSFLAGLLCLCFAFSGRHLAGL